MEWNIGGAGAVAGRAARTSGRQDKTSAAAATSIDISRGAA